MRRRPRKNKFICRLLLLGCITAKVIDTISFLYFQMTKIYSFRRRFDSIYVSGQRSPFVAASFRSPILTGAACFEPTPINGCLGSQYCYLGLQTKDSLGIPAFQSNLNPGFDGIPHEQFDMNHIPSVALPLLQSASMPSIGNSLGDLGLLDRPFLLDRAEGLSDHVFLSFETDGQFLSLGNRHGR